VQGVVVGGGSGIGRATCLALRGKATAVIVADRDIEAAEIVAQTLAASGCAAKAFRCDVRNIDQVQALREFAVAQLSSVNFAVLSAGITQSGGIAAGDPDRWRPVLETNVLGVAYCLRAFSECLAGAPGGQAVVIASLSGRESYAGQPLYIASKWGVVGLAHSVRKEAQAKGVRVTLIEPGLVDTPMSRSNPHAQRLLEQISPLSPDDVARAVVFVLEQPANVLVRELALQPVGQEI
jgi:NADP-dependent 3-hydroxy acid dehydrogenase YdfG